MPIWSSSGVGSGAGRGTNADRIHSSAEALSTEDVGGADLILPHDALAVDGRSPRRRGRRRLGAACRTDCRWARRRRIATGSADRAWGGPDRERRRRPCAAVGAAGVGGSALRHGTARRRSRSVAGVGCALMAMASGDENQRQTECREQWSRLRNAQDQSIFDHASMLEQTLGPVEGRVKSEG